MWGKINAERLAFQLMLVQLCLQVAFGQFGRKNRQKEEQIVEEETQDDNGFDEQLQLFALLLVGMLSFLFLAEKLGFGQKDESKVKVVVIATGLPKRGMGWYHLTQLLEMPNVEVISVVEPFFANKKLCANPPASFLDLVSELESKGIKVASSVGDLDEFTEDTICLISGRTADNPKFFHDCVMNGCKCIYLEKPGAPTIEELEGMEELATLYQCEVYMGFNKNVTPYVQKALAFSKRQPNSEIMFCHNNSYKREELAECFTRNSEGLCKNMAIHELALLVSFFGVTVDSIAKFEIIKPDDKSCNEKLTLQKEGSSMPKVEYVTDLVCCTFKITTKDGRSVSVMANRCGGNVSHATVTDASGNTLKKFEFPDAELLERVNPQIAADPAMMPYFFIQSDDYLELKERVTRSVLEGTEPKDVATIETAIEALRLAEYCTEKLSKAVKS